MARTLLAIVGAIVCLFSYHVSTAPTDARTYSYRQWAAMQAARYYSWAKPSLPDISTASVVEEKVPKFHGEFLDVLHSKCDKDCQMAKSSKPANMEELQNELRYDTLDLMRQTHLTTSLQFDFVPPDILGEEVTQTDDVIDDDVEKVIEEEDITEEYSDISEDESENTRSRQKRKVYGVDTRFTIPAKRFLSSNPFSSAVKISTGCSGIMISPRHVLTSAHCLHDGTKFIQGTRRIKVGKLTDEPKRKRKGKKKKKDKGRKEKKRNKNSKKISKRVQRSVTNATEVKPYFKWTRARRIHLPTEWTTSANVSSEDYPIEFDFAVIELKKDLSKLYMDIGISPEKNKIPGKSHNVHFTGFDNDKPDTFVFRFCPVQDESPDIIYHYCDAHQGTSGSGVYIKLFDMDKGIYMNRVVALFSGNQQVRLPDGTSKNYNTAVRITPVKYTLICHWTDGFNANCNK